MDVRVEGPKVAGSEQILTREALDFVARLHREFNQRREQLLARRAERQKEFDAGKNPRFLDETKKVRESDWKVAETPRDLLKRYVEITGPVERKMMINALNSGADVFMDVFKFAQDALRIPQGSIRATVLIETLPAAFEMDEILYELREHMSGLNAGRWDYLFSLIKTLRTRRDAVLPDRAQVTMTVPFMRAYTELLIKTCHRRGAYAMGGMAQFIPSRKDKELNERALAKVRDDKKREATDGFDGTWVAHPDLVTTAREEFVKVLGDKPHQRDRLRSEVQVTAEQLVETRVPGGKVTEAGFRTNINVALQYLQQWLGGNGAAAIHNLTEDAATAEISRAQLWQLIHDGASLDDGRTASAELYAKIRDEEVQSLGAVVQKPAALLDGLVTAKAFAEFLTLP